ncbi:MAG: hypothetical protein HBSAPP04_22550 [Ignavibacteriaceae bacterium]|nr:MAG: hypothetical protein HBSAPP04_22550 [Ignavibacteriaceae bacterium]
MSVTTENLAFQPETTAPTHTFTVVGAGSGDQVLIHAYKNSSFQEPFRSFTEAELDVSGGEVVFEPESNEVLSWPATCYYRLYFDNGGVGEFELLFQGSVTITGGAIVPPLQSSALQLMKVRQILTADGNIPFTFPAGSVILGVVVKTTATVTGTISLDEAGGDDIISAEDLPSNGSKFYLPDNAGQYFVSSGLVAVDCSAWPGSGGVDITIIYTVI